MSDIVGKLRIFASHRNPSRTMDKATIAEAADEIERLRAKEALFEKFMDFLRVSGSSGTTTAR
jgi:hypothetical protein